MSHAAVTENFNATAEQTLWYHSQIVEPLEPGLSQGPQGDQRLPPRLKQAVEELAAAVQA